MQDLTDLQDLTDQLLATFNQLDEIRHITCFIFPKMHLTLRIGLIVPLLV